MRTRTMTTSMMTTALLLLVAMGCGDLTEGAGKGSIGSLRLLSKSPDGAGLEPVGATKRVFPMVGTGTIGPVTVTYYDLHPDACASPIPEVAINCKTTPDAVTIGPDGAPWFTLYGSLVRVAEDDTVGRVPTPRGSGSLGALTAGAGALWIIAWDPQGVLRFDPATRAAEFFSVPGPLARPTAAVVDGHGDVWLTGGDRAVVGRIDARRDVYVVAQEDGLAPITVVGGGLTVRSDGAVFMSDYSAGRVGQVRGSGFDWTDLGGDVHAPSGIVSAPDGSIWFVDLGIPNQVGRIDAAGVLQTFVLPAAIQGPSGKSISTIAVAPDGAAWFTVPESSSVARVTPAGEVAYVSLEGGSLPRGIAIDAHGRIWVTTRGFVRLELGS